MSKKLQFAAWLLALGLCAVAALPAQAQNRPPKSRQQHQQPQAHHDARQYQSNRPPASTGSVAPNTNRTSPTSGPGIRHRPPSANTPPAKKLHRLNPQEKQRALENNKDFQSGHLRKKTAG